MNNYIDRMTTENRAGVFSDTTDLMMPTIQDAHRAIESLNGRTISLLCFHGRDGASLTIGGGQGQYIVYITTSDQQLWNLIDEAQKTAVDILLNVGGQECDFPAKLVVSKSQVDQAIETFFQTGGLNSFLQWEK